MPLPPLPPSNTRRMWVDYQTANAQHSMMFRVAASATASSLQVIIDQFLTALAPSLYEIVILQVREAASGSDVTNPISSLLQPSYGATPEPGNLMPRELRFESRSLDGRKGSIGVFGWEGNTPNDYRLSVDEDANVDAARDILQANNTMVGLSISGFPVTWKSYANINFHSYWERQART